MDIETSIQFLRTYAEDEVEPVTYKAAKIAAMILYKGVPVAVGCNKEKTHPIIYKYNHANKCCTLHAEVDVIIKAQKKISKSRLKNCTLVVVRVKCNAYKRRKENYVLGIAKPCENCIKFIEENEIRKIIYTNDCTHREELSYTTFKRAA